MCPPGCQSSPKNQLTTKRMTIEEAQKLVDQWIKTYGVRYFSELTNMAVLTEEVGELALANQTGVDLSESFKTNLKKKTERDKNRFL